MAAFSAFRPTPTKTLGALVRGSPSFVLSLLLVFAFCGPYLACAQTGLEVTNWEIEENDSTGPPKDLRITAPTATGQYPVVIFQHGTSMYTQWYSTLLDHAASAGYVIIAPQMYTNTPPSLTTNATNEVLEAAAVHSWVMSNENNLGLPSGVTLDLNKVAIAGHSRGGKVAVALARKLLGTNVTINALIALDPVDGPKDPIRFWDFTTPSIPPTSTFTMEHSIDLGVPALLFGSGLGPRSKVWGAPACAPAPLGYAQYFKAFNSTTYQFVSMEYGHMDLMDVKKEGCPWSRSRWSNCLATTACKGVSNWERRGPLLTRYLGTLLGAFLESALQNKHAAFQKLTAEWQNAPIKLERPEVFPPGSRIQPKRAVVETDSVHEPELVLRPAYAEL